MDIAYDLDLTSAEISGIEKNIGFFTAGYFSVKGSLVAKYAAGLYNHMCNTLLPEYSGTLLYPACVKEDFDPEAAYNSNPWYRIKEITDSYLSDNSREPDETTRKVSLYAKNYQNLIIGNHSNPNFRRILSEGFGHYKQRILHLMNASDCKSASLEIYQALLLVIEGIAILMSRMKKYLEQLCFDDKIKEKNRQLLIEAFTVVPMQPAKTFSQAVVATNLLFYMDSGDNLGRIDSYLNPYYCADTGNGCITRDEAKSLITALWDSVERLGGWNACIGGSDAEGKDLSNELTVLCLETSKGRRRPNLALKIHDATPNGVWDAAMDCVSGGSGIPAFYAEKNILQGLKDNGVQIAEDDEASLAFGGCTETLIDGCSNIGTNDYLLNTLKLLEQCVYDELIGCDDFKTFYENYIQVVKAEVKRISQIVNDQQRNNAKFNPALIRSLTTDDCIDKGELYYCQGTRYTWSLITLAALPNTADSLYAIKKAVFDEKRATATELCNALRADYAGWEELFYYIKRLPKYGNDIDDVDIYAKELSHLIALEFREYTPYRGGKFLCFCNTYWVFDELGRAVGATPDGRKAYTPVAESIAAAAGRDVNGPTASINSAAKLDQINSPGTMVFNIRFTLDIMKRYKHHIRALIQTYFNLGGNQLQINIVDQRILEKAIAHPDEYSGLIVRVAGYSEYFTRLSLDIRKSILERTAYDLLTYCAFK